MTAGSAATVSPVATIESPSAPAASPGAAERGRPSRRRGRAGRAAGSAAVGVGLVGGTAVLWEVAKAAFDLDDRTLPHLWDVVAYLGSETSKGENYGMFLLNNLLVTARSAALGLLCGALLGVVTGVVIARSRLLGAGVLPLVVAAQTVPIVAVSPAMVLWLGTNWTTKIAIATYLTYFPVAVATAKGIQSVPGDALDLLHTYSASRRTVLFHVELPAAAPLIAVGLETAAAFAVVGTIVGELPFGSKTGLGVVILTSWQFYTIEPSALYCVALAACLLGGALVLAIRLLGSILIGYAPEGGSL
ncbi:MAG: ABC transporter permease subunit [Acidimicrobiales bacterium]